MYKAVTILFVLSVVTAGINTCRKVEDKTGSQCQAGKNFCVKIGDELFNTDATLQALDTTNPGYRVTFTDGSGSTQRVLKLDIYGSNVTAGTYQFTAADTPIAGSAQLRFVTQAKEYVSNSGSVTVTDVAPHSISGSFSGTVERDGESLPVANGNFSEVKN